MIPSVGVAMVQKWAPLSVVNEAWIWDYTIEISLTSVTSNSLWILYEYYDPLFSERKGIKYRVHC